MAKNIRVPMSSPEITDQDRQEVMQVLDTRYLSMGPKIEAFEKEVRQLVNAKYAIGVSSGTTGLHLCVRAANIEANDLVITSPFSFVASTNVLLFEKAIPIFVDVDPITGNLDVDQVEKVISDFSKGERVFQKWLPRKLTQPLGKLKAVLSIDVFGQPAEYDRLEKLCNENNLILIEDSCEALGAEYKGKPTGLFGKYGVFAFYPNKQMTTGEGGIIVTNDDKAGPFMQALRNQGRAPGDSWLQHTYLGYNYRLDELSAALGYSQIRRIEFLLKKREQVAQWYQQNLSSIPEIEIPTIVDSTTRMSWFVYVIRLKKFTNRDQFAQKLINNGIPVRPYFLPIHLQPYMIKQFGYEEGDYPITEDLGNRGLAIPFSGVMTKDQVNIVCETIVNCLKK